MITQTNFQGIKKLSHKKQSWIEEKKHYKEEAEKIGDDSRRKSYTVQEKEATVC